MDPKYEQVLHIIGSISDQSKTISISAVQSSMEWAAAGVDCKPALDWLVQNGYAAQTEENGLTLTQKGMLEAERLREQKICEEFDELINRCTQSSAYLDFCEELYGYRLYLFNMMDKRQLDDLFADLNVTGRGTVLDIGCGTGSLLNRIVEKTGCKGIGIDRLPGYIVERLSPKVEYRQTDMDEAQADDSRTVLFVDSLYFSKDMDKLLGCLKDKAVTAYMYFSTYLFEEEGDKALLQADQTPLAKSLNRLGLAYKTKDYSACEYQMYKKGIRLLEKYEATFAEQGLDDIYERRLNEYRFGETLYAQGRASRFLYIVEGK